jgi:hypothetical protein
MKLAVIASHVGASAAFAPSQVGRSSATSLQAAAELEGLIGVDIETGKKIVRVILGFQQSLMC